MAASSSQKTKMLTLLFIVPLLNGAVSQEPARGDNAVKKPVTTQPPGQGLVWPTLDVSAETTEATRDHDPSDATTSSDPETDQATKATVKVPTNMPTAKPGTPEPDPPRGDGSINKPKPEDVVCKGKEAVDGKNAVHLKLNSSSNCKDTQMRITSVLQELCGEDCKLELYQENNSDEVLVSGKYVEDDVTGMTNKFNNDNIKDKTNIKEAVPRWVKNSKLVLALLLLTGVLLAALLVAGYYFKTHRKNSKGVKLAESFQVDEENQANTLVSVAPLHQEPLDKPIINGESPPENGTNPTPTTNGHSANQTQVADTEM
ncbi:hematopoietic progenitor cell antigen CD34 [Nothobranchius furzeri]|uniref:CD34 molecule n=1 Tax=Nothobranchius furzeri TaxID=105023 RepID=A0A1A8TY06_NOTFU|nr:CD34 molecule [Nothobranchius furzeri]